MNFIPVALTVISLASLVFGHGDEAKTVTLGLKCAAELGLPPTMMESIKKMEIEKLDDPKAKCFFHCWQEKAGWIDASGKLNEEEITKFFSDIDPAKIKELVAKCGAEKGADECETATKQGKCIHDGIK